MVEMKSLDSIATDFFHTFYNKEPLADSGSYIANLSIAEAYTVQDLVAQKRIQRGTSKAIRAQLGFSKPISARLFRPHIFQDNVTIDWSGYVNCAIEPEMVLKIGKDLKGKNLSDEALIDLLASVRRVDDRRHA